VAAALRALPARCQVFTVALLLRELILHVVATAPLPVLARAAGASRRTLERLSSPRPG